MREVYTQKNKNSAISALNGFHAIICIYFALTLNKFAIFKGYSLTDEPKAHWILCGLFFSCDIPVNSSQSTTRKCLYSVISSSAIFTEDTEECFSLPLTQVQITLRSWLQVSSNLHCRYNFNHRPPQNFNLEERKEMARKDR